MYDLVPFIECASKFFPLFFFDMSLIDSLYNTDIWIGFYENRAECGYINENETYDLHKFIRDKEFIPVLDKIKRGEAFSIPAKRYVNKIDSTKKRSVYTFSREENYVLKILTFLLIRKYDYLFSKSLYSFRVNKSVGKAINKIKNIRKIDRCFTYKIDVSNYFNSINVEKLLLMLKDIFVDDMDLYDFFFKMLTSPYSLEDGNIIKENKGVMAGTPTASFLSNVYLSKLDAKFDDKEISYFRYSDDIMIFAKTIESIEKGKCLILNHLLEYNLTTNKSKEVITLPGEKWSFLGFSYHQGNIDISDVSLEKMKSKMRRKSRALVRWKEIKHKSSEAAISAFIKKFNKKLYETTDIHETNWSRWYFPIITTDKGLKEIDKYMQQCIRFISTGKHTKSNYNFRYEDMKRLGYRCLVNEWYKYKTLKRKLFSHH